MDSDELEYVEDSEPERWEQQSRRTTNGAGSMDSSKPGRATPEQEVLVLSDSSPLQHASPEASTSRFFHLPSPIKRRRVPLDSSLSHSPPPLSRKISLSSFPPIDDPPAPTSTSAKRAPFPLSFPPLAQVPPQHARANWLGSTSSGSIKRKSDPKPAEGEKKPKKRNSTSQITSAAALLRQEQAESSKSKSKKGKARASVSSVSSLEVSMDEHTSFESDGIVVPPRLDASHFNREVFGLPPLAPKPAIKSQDKKEGKKKRRSSLSLSDVSGEEEGADEVELSAEERFRAKLKKYDHHTSASGELKRSNSAGDHKPSSSSSRPKGKLKASAFPPPPPEPISLPPDDRIRVLDSCPLCDDAWKPNKTLLNRSVHLRKCALEKDYTAETVRILVERRILDLAHEREVEQREVALRRTVFDRAIGVGEGAGSGREVRLVGIEGGWGAGEEEEQKALDMASEELRALTRKTATDKVIKVAREIKLERKEAEEGEALKRARKAVREKEEQEEVDRALPRATGLLGPVSTRGRFALHERVGQFLEDLGGTGLTQVAATSAAAAAVAKPAPAPLPASTNRPASTYFAPAPAEDDPDADIIILDSTIAAALQASEMEPPSTQGFEPSKLAQQYFVEGKMDVMALPSKVVARGRKRRSDEWSTAEDGEGEGSNSLWKAAGGRDEVDETIRRVVLPPPPARSPSPPQRHSHARTYSTSSSVPSVVSTRLKRASPSPPPPPSPEVETLTRAMRTHGLGGREEGDEGGTGAWVDERGREDEEEVGGPGLLVWEGGAGGGVDGAAVSMGEWRDEEGLISSEEEPLMELSRRLSMGGRKGRGAGTPSSSTSGTPEVSPVKSKGKRTAKAAPKPKSTPVRRRPSTHSLTSPSSASSDDDGPPRLPPGLPDYAALPIPELQKQVARYGFRPSKERSVLVDQLTKVWVATHPQVARSLKKKKKVVEPKATVKGRKKKGEVVVEGELEVGEEVESLGERLRALMVGEEEVYLKILRYEPILFDDLVTLAAVNGIKCAKPTLMRFLDEQCITFYIQDPTNGSRKRYK